MPFGLKNVGATYKRAVTVTFHNMLVEDYEGDIFVKFKDVYNHVDDLRKILIRCKQYN